MRQVTGFLDLRATEVVVPVGMVLAASFVLGAVSPHQAWLAAILVGIGIPLMHISAALLGIAVVDPPKPNVLSTFLALIPAAVGAGEGAGFGWLLRDRGRYM